MKLRSAGLSLALCLFGIAVCFADNANMGTWKLDEAKSKFAAGATKNSTVVYEAAGDDVKVTVDGTNSDGTPAHNEWTGKFNGKDYPVTGSPVEDSRAYTKINERTLMAVGKKGGKAISNIHIVVSADGKTRTVTARTTDASGKKMTSVAVYKKQ